MEKEFDRLFYWQTLVTKLGGGQKALAFFCEDEHDQKQIWHEIERDVLIPYLERNKQKLELRTRAQDGEAEAQYQLGIGYKEQNKPTEALEWLRKAADQDYVESFFPVCQLLANKNEYNALLHYSQRGIQLEKHSSNLYFYQGFVWKKKKNNVHARDSFEKGAALENVHCLNEIAGLDYEQKDYDKAFLIWKQLADSESAVHSVAMYNLGHCYFNGFGTPKDRLAAKPWFEKAATLGNKSAIDMLKLYR